MYVEHKILARKNCPSLTFTDAVTVDVSLKYNCGPVALPHQEPPVNGRPSSLSCKVNK